MGTLATTLSALAALVAGAGIFAILYHVFIKPDQIEHVSPSKVASNLTSPKNRLFMAINRTIPQSKGDADRLRGRIARAGLSITPAIYHALSITFWAVVAAAIVVVAPLLKLPFSAVLALAVIVGIAALPAPRLYLNNRARGRAKEIQVKLPKALDLLTVSVEAGLTMNRAMRLYSEKDTGVLACEFGLVDREVNTLGYSREDALTRMANRCSVDDLSLFVGAVNASVSDGTQIGDVLRSQSESAFERRRQAIEEQGNKLQAEMILPLGLMLIASFIGAVAPMVINVMSATSGVF